MLAAKNNYRTTVELLIEKGANVNFRSNNPYYQIKKNSALILAAQNGHIDMVSLLLDNGADIRYCNKDGQTALTAAIKINNLPLVELLIKKGAKVNFNKEIDPIDLKYLRKKGPRPADTFVPLVLAAQNGCVEIAKLLIKNEAKVNLQDNISQQTALMCAAKNGHDALVKFLISKRANITFTDIDGKSALDLAVANGHDSVVEIFLKFPSCINVINQRGLLVAAAANGHCATVDLLIKNDAFIDAKLDGETALMAAVSKKYYSICNLLIENNADVLFRTKGAITAVSKAMKAGHIELSNILFQKWLEQMKLKQS